MSFSTFSTFNSNVSKKMTTTSFSTLVRHDFSANVGPFTTTSLGTSPSITTSTTKTISGKGNFDGTYNVRGQYWVYNTSVPTALQYYFDSGSSTYGQGTSTVNSNNHFGRDGTQVSYPGLGYNSTTGLYLLNNFTNIGGTLYYGDFVEIEFPRNIILIEYLIQHYDNSSPKQIYFAGSIDGLSWALLGSHVNNTITAKQWITITMTPTIQAYKYIRMIANTTQSGLSYWTIASINMTISFP